MTFSELETSPLDTARRLAEGGDLDGAAAILAELAARPGSPDRAQAAVGLAVVLEQRGDVEGARAAARTALATGHPEFAAQAACHLAQGFEREGRPEQARGAWQAVLGVGTPAYVPLAHLALARLAGEVGDYDEAEAELRAAIETGHRDPHAAEDERYENEQYETVEPSGDGDRGLDEARAQEARAQDARDVRGPAVEARVHAAQQLADLLIEREEPGEAADVLIDALEVASGDDAARLRVQLGIAHLEMACAEFAGALEEGGEAQVSALAIELLARTLPLRGRDDAAGQVWAYGLDHQDETLAAEVRLRYER
ncbi:tetratricopeptide repeat protein [Nonomuraea sp. MCN248]|uniref:Tetratricopeptide repeat protein n=1 Tax=Nonomuraea corallina TaxID=2989783 RepID=A0ABT4SEM4_9ACTN|nr:tetratricopeptide repeat protein [Nonomuraea corallina]MDA0635647.1 tetratricopeptide repeat protein [Nonomuraea corallina]